MLKRKVKRKNTLPRTKVNVDVSKSINKIDKVLTTLANRQ